MYPKWEIFSVFLPTSPKYCPPLTGLLEQDHSELAVGVAATMAHEIGHNFGMSHDSKVCCQAKPEDGGCIMAAATGCGIEICHDQTNLKIWKILTYYVYAPFSPWPRHPFPRVFNDCNLKELKSYLSSGGGKCLFNLPNTKAMYGGQRCGNGYLEDGEECDCGEEEVGACRVSWISQYIQESWPLAVLHVSCRSAPAPAVTPTTALWRLELSVPMVSAVRTARYWHLNKGENQSIKFNLYRPNSEIPNFPLRAFTICT